jgi:hypothetical protein
MSDLEPPPNENTPVEHPQFRQWIYQLWEKTSSNTAALGTTISSAVVSFIQAGLGAVERTMQDKAREIFSVKDFGAVGDGVTDDSIAFAKAFAAANLQFKGRPVLRATTVPGSLTPATTSIAVASAAGFPTSFPYACTISDGVLTEFVTVTNLVGNTFTVTRSASPLAWAAGAAFSQIGNGYAITTASLYIPAGDYLVNTGLTTETLNCSIIGAGRENVRIKVGSGQYFLTVTTNITETMISGMAVSGGAGFLKFSSTGINVQGHITIRDNNFSDYTECAIASFSSDDPYWKIHNNMFYGTTSSKGIALDGLIDQTEISNNSFLLNRYAVKLGQGGNNAKLFNNDFLRFAAAGGGLVDVWVVPNPFNGGLGYINSGEGFHSFSNKYGNEFLNAADYRILYADEAAGTNFATRNHATTVSTGFITGHSFERDLVNGVSNLVNGFIYSYTPKVRAIKVSEVFGSAKYPFILQYDAGVTFTDDRLDVLNTLDLSQTVDWPETSNSNWSNKPAAGLVTDPFGMLAGQPSYINDKSGSDGGFKSLIATTLPLWVAPAGAFLWTTLFSSAAQIRDAVGDYNGAIITYTDPNGYILGTSASADADRRCWIELDVQSAASLSLTSVRLDVFNGTTGALVLRRFIKLPPNGTWQTVRFPFVSSTAATFNISLFPGDYLAATRTAMQVGRIRAYQATDPSDAGSVFKQNRITWTPNGGAAIANNASAFVAFAVQDAEFGDFAVASFNLNLGNLTISAAVSAPDTVTVTLTNNTGGAVTLGTGIVAARVYKLANP